MKTSKKSKKPIASKKKNKVLSTKKKPVVLKTAIKKPIKKIAKRLVAKKVKSNKKRNIIITVTLACCALAAVIIPTAINKIAQTDEGQAVLSSSPYPVKPVIKSIVATSPTSFKIQFQTGLLNDGADKHTIYYCLDKDSLSRINNPNNGNLPDYVGSQILNKYMQFSGPNSNYYSHSTNCRALTIDTHKKPNENYKHYLQRQLSWGKYIWTVVVDYGISTSLLDQYPGGYPKNNYDHTIDPLSKMIGRNLYIKMAASRYDEGAEKHYYSYTSTPSGSLKGIAYDVPAPSNIAMTRNGTRTSTIIYFNRNAKNASVEFISCTDFQSNSEYNFIDTISKYIDPQKVTITGKTIKYTGLHSILPIGSIPEPYSPYIHCVLVSKVNFNNVALDGSNYYVLSKPTRFYFNMTSRRIEIKAWDGTDQNAGIFVINP